jgi:hypothetical protein
MNVREIVERYLRENGFEGLFSQIGECGCPLSDFMPCYGEDIADCEPGYSVKAGDYYGPDDEYDGEPDDIIIVPEKPKVMP